MLDPDELTMDAGGYDCGCDGGLADMSAPTSDSTVSNADELAAELQLLDGLDADTSLEGGCDELEPDELLAELELSHGLASDDGLAADPGELDPEELAAEVELLDGLDTGSDPGVSGGGDLNALIDVLAANPGLQITLSMNG